MSSIHLHPRVLFYREGINWVAHCLEFDLIGDGATREKALERLNDEIALQVETCAVSRNPANLFKPAPCEYFAMYEAGQEIAPGQLRLITRQMVIDETHAREFRQSL